MHAMDTEGVSRRKRRIRLAWADEKSWWWCS